LPSADASISRLRPWEAELLRTVARVTLWPGQAARIRALASRRVDWRRVIAASRRHGILALTYRHLADACPALIPSETFERLERETHAIVERNLRFTAELVRVLTTLEAGGVVAIPFKGPALAASVYGNLGLRQFTDLDLFVRRRDVLSAATLLERNGYRMAHHHSVLSRRATFLDTGYELSLVHDASNIVVELHWRLVPGHFGVSFEADTAWERHEHVRVGGHDLSTLAPEELLLVLCVHGAKHGWERLQWVCDVAELIRARPGLDWERVDDLAKKGSAELVVSLGLCVAADLLDAPIPPDRLNEAWRTPLVACLAATVRRQVDGGVPGPRSLRNAIVLLILARKRWRERVRALWRLLTTPTTGDRDFMPLPERLSFLYPAVRAVRLTQQHVFARPTLLTSTASWEPRARPTAAPNAASVPMVESHSRARRRK
jgi:Uncharacterised nucleotidyltransferase